MQLPDEVVYAAHNHSHHHLHQHPQSATAAVSTTFTSNSQPPQIYQSHHQELNHQHQHQQQNHHLQHNIPTYPNPHHHQFLSHHHQHTEPVQNQPLTHENSQVLDHSALRHYNSLAPQTDSSTSTSTTSTNTTTISEITGSSLGISPTGTLPPISCSQHNTSPKAIGSGSNLSTTSENHNSPTTLNNTSHLCRQQSLSVVSSSSAGSEHQSPTDSPSGMQLVPATTSALLHNNLTPNNSSQPVYQPLNGYQQQTPFQHQHQHQSNQQHYQLNSHNLNHIHQHHQTNIMQLPEEMTYSNHHHHHHHHPTPTSAPPPLPHHHQHHQYSQLHHQQQPLYHQHPDSTQQHPAHQQQQQQQHHLQHQQTHHSHHQHHLTHQHHYVPTYSNHHQQHSHQFPAHQHHHHHHPINAATGLEQSGQSNLTGNHSMILHHDNNNNNHPHLQHHQHQLLDQSSIRHYSSNSVVSNHHEASATSTISETTALSLKASAGLAHSIVCGQNSSPKQQLPISNNHSSPTTLTNTSHLYRRQSLSVVSTNSAGSDHQSPTDSPSSLPSHPTALLQPSSTHQHSGASSIAALQSQLNQSFIDSPQQQVGPIKQTRQEVSVNPEQQTATRSIHNNSKGSEHKESQLNQLHQQCAGILDEQQQIAAISSPNNTSNHGTNASNNNNITPNNSTTASNDNTNSSSTGRSKRLRTSFKHNQLKEMKRWFSRNQNPDAKELKTLAQTTGLSKRVLQVWFQNARAKHRRNMAKVANQQVFDMNQHTSHMLQFQQQQQQHHHHQQQQQQQQQPPFYHHHSTRPIPNQDQQQAVPDQQRTQQAQPQPQQAQQQQQS